MDEPNPMIAEIRQRIKDTHEASKEVVRIRDQAIVQLEESLTLRIEPSLLRHLREQIYKFYEPNLVLLDIQMAAFKLIIGE